ncbi:ABC transporter-like protein [Paenibacillus alvei DSM 29]|nr:ABC transporter-like protein [Paenibacillus alvei DSM 29]
MSRNTSLSMSWLLRYVIPVRGRLLFLLVMLLVSTAFQLVNPQIVQQFIDTAASQGTLSTLLLLAGLYLIIAALTQLITVAISYLGNDISWRATNTLRADLLKHCLGLDMHFHNRKTPGEMIERIDGDVTGMSNFLRCSLFRLSAASFCWLASLASCLP